MRLLPLAALALLLSPTLHAGDLILRATGVVSTVPGTPPASFLAAQVGEPIEVVALVVETPVQTSANSASYGLDYTGSYVRIGNTVEPIVQLLPSPEIEINNSGGEMWGYMLASIGPGDAQVGVFFGDATGDVLQSLDLRESLGRAGAIDPAPSSSIQLFNPTASLTATLDELSIEDLPFGTPFCGPPVPNSSGVAAVLRAHGRDSLNADRFYLGATDLPVGAFGLFLAGDVAAPVVPLGSLGALCISNPGRFNGPGQIQQASAFGRLNLLVDLAALPTPTGTTPAVSGQTWAFQCWYRDTHGGASANTTNAVEVRFL